MGAEYFHPANPPGNATGEIPRAFLHISEFRDEVGKKRVDVGERRRYLQFALNELTTALGSLGAYFQQLQPLLEASHLHDLSSETKLLDKLLGRYMIEKTHYCELEDELNGLEYSLAEYEHRVYDQLCRPEGPVSSAFNKSLPIESDRLSLPPMPPYPDDYMAFEGDPYELNFGYGTAIGALPFSRSNKTHHGIQKTPLPSYQNTTEELFPLSVAVLEVFPPLFIAGNGDGILHNLITNFQSTKERVDRWLLHTLHVSEWEIRRLYLIFLAESEAGITKSHLDVNSWSFWVIQTWSQDNDSTFYSCPSQHTSPLTSLYSEESLPSILAAMKLSTFAPSTFTCPTAPFLSNGQRNGRLTTAQATDPSSTIQAAYSCSDGYFGQHSFVGPKSLIRKDPEFALEKYAQKDPRQPSPLPSPLPSPELSSRVLGSEEEQNIQLSEDGQGSELFLQAWGIWSRMAPELDKIPTDFDAESSHELEVSLPGRNGNTPYQFLSNSLSERDENIPYQLPPVMSTEKLAMMTEDEADSQRGSAQHEVELGCALQQEKEPEKIGQSRPSTSHSKKKGPIPLSTKNGSMEEEKPQHPAVDGNNRLSTAGVLKGDVTDPISEKPRGFLSSAIPDQHGSYSTIHQDVPVALKSPVGRVFLVKRNCIPSGLAHSRNLYVFRSSLNIEDDEFPVIVESNRTAGVYRCYPVIHRPISLDPRLPISTLWSVWITHRRVPLQISAFSSWDRRNKRGIHIKLTDRHYRFSPQANLHIDRGTWVEILQDDLQYSIGEVREAEFPALPKPLRASNSDTEVRQIAGMH